MGSIWRIRIDQCQSGNYAALGEVEMHDTVGGGDLCSGGTPACDAYYQTGYEADKAFDNNNSTMWNSGGGSLPHWIQYSFSGTTHLVEVVLRARHDGWLENSPKAFAVVVSHDDGLTWCQVASFTNLSAWSLGEARTFGFTEPDPPQTDPHRYWRLYITEFESQYVSIAKLALHGTVGGADLTGSGTGTGSSQYDGNYAPSYAFDNLANTCWHCANGASAPQWLQYDFGAGNAYNIPEIVITARDNQGNQGPKAFDWQWSDDGSAWHTVFSKGGQTGWVAGSLRTYSFYDYTNIRVSQAGLGILYSDQSDVRVSQTGIGILYSDQSDVRVSQTGIAILYAEPSLIREATANLESLTTGGVSARHVASVNIEILDPGPDTYLSVASTSLEVLTSVAQMPGGGDPPGGDPGLHPKIETLRNTFNYSTLEVALPLDVYGISRDVYPGVSLYDYSLCLAPGAGNSQSKVFTQEFWSFTETQVTWEVLEWMDPTNSVGAWGSEMWEGGVAGGIRVDDVDGTHWCMFELQQNRNVPGATDLYAAYLHPTDGLIHQAVGPWNATTMKWLRIRNTGGVTYFEYSADRIFWNTWYTGPFSITGGTLTAYAIARTVTGNADVGQFRIDNLNTTPGEGEIIPSSTVAWFFAVDHLPPAANRSTSYLALGDGGFSRFNAGNVTIEHDDTLDRNVLRIWGNNEWARRNMPETGVTRLVVGFRGLLNYGWVVETGSSSGFEISVIASGGELHLSRAWEYNTFGTSVGAQLGTWAYYEFDFTFATVGGAITIRRNGNVIAEVTNVNTLPSAGPISWIRFGGGGTDQYNAYTDFYLRDAPPFYGPIKLIPMWPDEDTLRGFTPSAGSQHYACVDEVEANLDADYVQAEA